MRTRRSMAAVPAVAYHTTAVLWQARVTDRVVHGGGQPVADLACAEDVFRV